MNTFFHYKSNVCYTICKNCEPNILIERVIYNVKVLELFIARFGQKHYILTDTTTAEFIKYMANTFLAVKVSVVNEFYRMSKTLGVNWNDALEGFVSDPRIGNSHTQVPGHDGKLGFGGTCFPKDINALITMGKELGVDMNTLEAAWKTNLEVRPEQDWKQLVGRAITPTPTPH
jgi:UDPglucose 6-dehydrogenase